MRTLLSPDAGGASVATAPTLAVRVPDAADIPGLVALVNTLAVEARELFIMPIEGPEGPQALQSHLAAIAKTGHEAVLIAELGGRIVGLLTASRNLHPSRAGVAEVGVGVLADMRRKGVGLALMAAIEIWAGELGVHRLELTVVASNLTAIALYRRLGYAVEGVKQASARIDGKLVDQLMMAKFL